MNKLFYMPDVASAHGVLPPRVRHELRARCLQHTIRPCAAAMLEQNPVNAGPAPASNPTCPRLLGTCKRA